MTKNVYYVGPETPLLEAYRAMSEHNFRHLLVLSDGGLVGVLSDRDILPYTRHDENGAIALASRVVKDVMSTCPITVGPEARVTTMVDAILENKIDCLPIVRGSSELVGLVTTTDLLMLLKPPYRGQEDILPFRFNLFPLRGSATVAA